MNANSMTPSELRALADKKEKENKPLKVGYLKADLFVFKGIERIAGGATYLSPQAQNYVNALVEEIKSKMTLELKAGTKFYYYYKDGYGVWYDDVNYGKEYSYKEGCGLLENISDLTT